LIIEIRNATDIDECARRPQQCNQTCNNIIGGYFCTCADGFDLINGHGCQGMYTQQITP